MAQDDDAVPPGEIDALDAWIEHALRLRPPQPHDGRAPSAPQLIQELEDFYRAEGQAVEGRLERVRQRLEQRLPRQQSKQERLPQAVPVSLQESRVHQMKESSPQFRERRVKDSWSQ